MHIEGISRRDCLSGTTMLALLALSDPAVAAGDAVTPEQFGAVGDGRSNDTRAFAALSKFVNDQGGGEIILRRTTYLVGLQSRGARPNYAFGPLPIMEFTGCTRPLIIRGNGARLRAAPGLRYGTFDPDTGRPTKHKMPYFGTPGAASPLASPYFAMIDVKNCRGPVEIADLELDGNDADMIVGGPYGDAGWQIPCSGIRLRANTAIEKLANIDSHHHLQDGLTIDGSPERWGDGLIDNVACEYNGRQGCSLVGGRRYAFTKCRFNHTGKSRLMSPPGAGVDIEAEDKTIRDLRFQDCEFSNNSGAGLIADSGDSEGALFERCKFVGATSWAAWPRKPLFAFTGCEFIGAIVGAYGDKDPSRAARFRACVFRDDPSLSPNGEIYTPDPLLTIAELPYSENARFDACRFELTHEAVLPWSTNVIYADCTMSQKAAKQSYPRGTFLGRNRITGNVDLYASRNLGELVVNGRPFPRTP